MCSVKRIGKVLFHWSQGFSSPSCSWQKLTLMIITSISQWTLFWVFKADSRCSVGFHPLEEGGESQNIPEGSLKSNSRGGWWSCAVLCGVRLGLDFPTVWFSHSLTLILQHLLTSEPWTSLFPHGFVLFRRTQTFGKAGQDLLGREGKACSEWTLSSWPESV